MAKGRVLVAMSGGVDSTVAALLLRRQGWEVEGATFHLWLPGQEGEPEAVRDAREVCAALDIPHHVLDYRELFREKVVDAFAEQYALGRTPNPCVVCNRNIKFGAFLDYAREQGHDKIATGHYAGIVYDEALSRWRLRRSAVRRKDQSYVLYHLSQEQLAAALLPLDGYDKDEIRAIARQEGLAVGEKADSQDICFIPDGDYGAFLDSYTEEDSLSGEFVDSDGNVIGAHQGIRHYTVGQRKGLGGGFAQPMFVRSISPSDNHVVLTAGEGLFSTVLEADEVSWIDFDEPTEPLRVEASIRYAHKPAPATVFPDGKRARVEFDEPQRAITPGQSVVFYRDEYVVGGGTIL